MATVLSYREVVISFLYGTASINSSGSTKDDPLPTPPKWGGPTGGGEREVIVVRMIEVPQDGKRSSRPSVWAKI